MATTRRTRFSRRIPDHVTDELVVVLKKNDTALQFNDLLPVQLSIRDQDNYVWCKHDSFILRALKNL